MSKHLYIIFIIPIVLLTGCFSVRYTFSGASTEGLETASVQYFANRAPIQNPGMSQQLTNMLQDQIISQTNLVIVNGIGDADFEGAITGLSTAPTAISGQDQAQQNRLTITVRVNYTNSYDDELSFESTFSRYIDYPSTQTFEQAQSQYMEELLELIVEDVFNKAFVNW
jgi:hypothetical protein